MVREIRVYFEGDRRLREGFAKFFDTLRDEARKRRAGFELISSRDGESATRDFELALRTHRGAWNILLRDSEGPLGDCPSHAESIFWMVEMMESWFHADKDALARFYGSDFNRNALKANPNVEEIPKNDVISGLRDATRHTSKGSYFDHKATHGCGLLARIDPVLVQEAAPNCQRMFEAVRNHLQAQT